MKIAHIINPVKVPPTSDLHVAQPITFESMRAAHDFSKDGAEVGLFAVAYPEDHDIIPGFFNVLPDLQRSVQDFGKFTQFKKYPALADILKAVYDASDAEYLIYTNADITLMPQFYNVVAQTLNEGYDALLINRRGLTTKYKSINELPLMYSDYGVSHPGYDCFVFKRALFPKLILGNVCIGIPFCEVTMVHNLIAFADKIRFIDNGHLTFHIGTEVMVPRNPEYYQYNRNEYETKVYPQLKPYLQLSKFPYSQLPFHKRMLKWILNPVFRTQQVAELEGKGWLRRLKHKIDRVRFSVLEKIR